MEARKLFLIDPIKRQICRHLTFQEIVAFRDSLYLSSLKHESIITACEKLPRMADGKFIVIDHIRKLVLPGVNKVTESVVSVIGPNFFESLKTAIQADKADALEFLLIHGDFQYSERLDAFCEAIRLGKESLIPLFLKYGIDIDGEYVQNNALITALNNEVPPSTLKLLLELGFDVNFARDSSTLLMIAIDRKSTDKIRILLEFGADVNPINDENVTALFLAVESDYSEAVELLLATGKIREDQYFNVVNSLHEAVGNDNLKIVSLFLKFGFNVNMKGRLGDTPLMVAVYLENYEMTKFLLEHGADPDIQDNEGESSRDFVKKQLAGNGDLEMGPEYEVIYQLFQSY